LYATLRACLPPADLVVYLTIPAELAAQRYRERNRTLEITQLEDLALLDRLIEDWVTTLPPERVLRLDAAAPDFGSDRNIAEVAANVLLRIAA
jgi:deoxyadenosine/deoxycytidine kinase